MLEKNTTDKLCRRYESKDFEIRKCPKMPAFDALERQVRSGLSSVFLFTPLFPNPSELSPVSVQREQHPF
jgi:hypothetical protein